MKNKHILKDKKLVCKNMKCQQRFGGCTQATFSASNISEDCSDYQGEWTYYQLEGQYFLRERWEEKAGKVKHTSTQRLPGPDELRKSEKSKVFEELLKQPRYQFYSSSVRAGKSFVQSMLNAGKSMKEVHQYFHGIWDIENKENDDHRLDAIRYSKEALENPCPFGGEYGVDFDKKSYCLECNFITNHACRQQHHRLSIQKYKVAISAESKDFSALRANRKVMGAFRYGLFGDVENKPQWDRLLAIEKKIKEYRETGNDELLVDIANLCELEFIEGIHPKKHFSAADDKGHVEGK